MKTILIVLIAFLGFSTQAQHCGWDYDGIIIVDVIDSKTKKLIPNLRITIINKLTRKPLRKEFYRDGKFVEDIVYFYQKDLDMFKNTSVFEFKYERVWLLGDSYGLRLDYQNKLGSYSILIEDIDSAEHGSYNSQQVALDQIHMFPLCTGSSNWNHVHDRAEVEGLNVLTIELEIVED